MINTFLHIMLHFEINLVIYTRQDLLLKNIPSRWNCIVEDYRHYQIQWLIHYKWYNNLSPNRNLKWYSTLKNLILLYKHSDWDNHGMGTPITFQLHRLIPSSNHIPITVPSNSDWNAIGMWLAFPPCDNSLDNWPIIHQQKVMKKQEQRNS